MNESTTLTNRERRENVAFLGQAFLASQRLPAEVLDGEQRALFSAGGAEQSRLFYTLLCYGALAAQPAPDSVVDADWRRFRDAGVVDSFSPASSTCGATPSTLRSRATTAKAR